MLIVKSVCVAGLQMCVMHPCFRICSFFAAPSIFEESFFFYFADSDLRVIVLVPCDKALSVLCNLSEDSASLTGNDSPGSHSTCEYSDDLLLNPFKSFITYIMSLVRHGNDTLLDWLAEPHSYAAIILVS